jgi:ketosteroid isomerase-like protein
MFEIWEGLRVDPGEFIEADDKVVVIGRAFATAKGSGMPLDTQIAFVWTVQDGKLVSNQVFTDRRAALEAAGLRE